MDPPDTPRTAPALLWTSKGIRPEVLGSSDVLDTECPSHRTLRQALQPGVADVPQLPVDKEADQRFVVHQNQEFLTAKGVVGGLL